MKMQIARTNRYKGTRRAAPAGVRITWVCPGCGEVRMLHPHYARQLSTCRSCKPGNMGKTNGMYGKPRSVEIRQAQSRRMKELWQDPEFREIWSATRAANWADPKVRAYRLAILQSPERCAKISASHLRNGVGSSPQAIRARQTPESCAKSSHSARQLWKNPAYRAKQLQQRSLMPRAYTSIERKTANVLRILGVKFRPQPLLGLNFIPDFYLPEYNRVVECDGTYWHGNIEARRKDWRRSRIMRVNGFKVSRLSEKFIMMEGRLLAHFRRLLGLCESFINKATAQRGTVDESARLKL